MKRLLILLITVSAILFADTPERIKAKIIGKVTTSLLGVGVVFIYTDDPSYKKIFVNEENIVETGFCNDADLILSSRLERYRSKCPPTPLRLYFATDYSDYMKNRDVAVGAFFWQKGRPNLILNEKVLKRLRIELPAEFDSYIE
ncbi:hypothetical protein NNO_1258 [Hydrogenimonas sp.]|nr:hypothetical protein NNO_1258 [Hydrogenimonas sp.]